MLDMVFRALLDLFSSLLGQLILELHISPVSSQELLLRTPAIKAFFYFLKGKTPCFTFTSLSLRYVFILLEATPASPHPCC